MSVVASHESTQKAVGATWFARGLGAPPPTSHFEGDATSSG